MSGHIRVTSFTWHEPGCCGGTKREFRVTRPDVYPPNTPGHNDASARQGYYVDACCAANAGLTARISYKGEIKPHEDLDVQWTW